MFVIAMGVTLIAGEPDEKALKVALLIWHQRSDSRGWDMQRQIQAQQWESQMPTL